MVIPVLVYVFCHVQAGGPSIRLATGRRDGTRSIATVAEANLPSPGEDAEKFSKKFMELGFNYKDIVSLLGNSIQETFSTNFCGNRTLFIFY